MKLFGKIIIAGWFLLGIILIADGIKDTISWTDDSVVYASINWWVSTNISSGLFSVTLAICLIWFPSVARYVGYTLSVIFGLYVLYIFAITPPDHRVSPMLILQILVLALVFGTVYLLWKQRKVK